MRIKPSFDRFVVRLLMILAFVGIATGCSLRGQQRNPSFAESARAPEPTVATPRIACGLDRGHGEGLASFDIIYQEKVPQQRVILSPEATTMLCTVLGQVSMLNVSGTSEWRPSAALALSLRDVASRAGASSIFVPMIVPYEQCENEAATVTNAAGDTVGRVETNRVHCAAAQRIDLRMFLFDANGVLLWKSWGVADRTSTAAVERETARVLSGIPAVFRDPGEPTPGGTRASSL